jgi:uncharacterized SAM-binding protein YcdF (DUF218 family)
MFRLLILSSVAAVTVTAIALTGSGLLLEGPQPPLERSDAIIVISGDEGFARLREGVRLFQQGWARRLIVSGAAEDGVLSNAHSMRSHAVESGVPPSAILVEPEAMDTFGNAVYTRKIMAEHQLNSAILVTSPYHLQRASMTFAAVFQGSGVRLIPRSAPDSEWRKSGWWTQAETRRLTFRELERIAYIVVTGRYN